MNTVSRSNRPADGNLNLARTVGRSVAFTANATRAPVSPGYWSVAFASQTVARSEFNVRHSATYLLIVFDESRNAMMPSQKLCAGPRLVIDRLQSIFADGDRTDATPLKRPIPIRERASSSKQKIHTRHPQLRHIVHRTPLSRFGTY